MTLLDGRFGLGFQATSSSKVEKRPITLLNHNDEIAVVVGWAPREYAMVHEVHLGICAPHWFIAIMLALPPLAWWLRFRRRRRRRQRLRHGLCEACGYDLRGSAGRCPECGAAAPDKPSPDGSDPALLSRAGG
jgi:hypothetical protein